LVFGYTEGKKIKKETNMNYFFEYEKKLKQLCKSKHLILKNLGKIGRDAKFDIYAVENRVVSTKKTICFLSGCHGEEYAGPLAILEFLEKEDINKIKIKLVFVPIVNPSGFNIHNRYNYLGQQLNSRPKGKKLAQEVKLICNYLQKYSFDFFHAIHEDSDKKAFYAYIFENKKEKIYRDILSIAKRYFKIDRSKTLEGDKMQNGLIINIHDNSFEDVFFKKGAKYSCCTETPGRMPVKKRIKLNAEIMHKIISFMQTN